MLNQFKLSELGIGDKDGAFGEAPSQSPSEQVFLKKPIIFRAIVQFTLYPNGKIYTQISKPLNAEYKGESRKKKPIKPAIVLGEAKKEAVNLLEGFQK